MTFVKGHSHGQRFTRNHTPWNKGKTGVYSEERLKELREQGKSVKWTPEVRAKLSQQKQGSKHPAWTGDDASYNAIHLWLRNTHGVPTKCENRECLGTSKRIEYAKRNGFEYERKRENYIALCTKCHRNYDFGNFPCEENNNEKHVVYKICVLCEEVFD